jgi:hypothetical protein
MADPSSELPAAAVRAREHLAAELGIGVDGLEVLSFNPVEWTDSCLGLGGPAESCLQAITPGWQVMLRAIDEDVVYEVRTDEGGDVVRFQPAADPGAELPAPAARAREQLAAELGVGLETVEVVSFHEEEWPDSCLGMAGPDEMCLQAITPGWLVLLSVNGQAYEAHTDRTGGSVRLGTGVPQARPAGSGIVFERSGGITGETITYRIDPAGVIEKLTGPEGADQAIEAILVDPSLVEELLAGLEAAGFFELVTDATPVVPRCDRIVYFLTVTNGPLTNSVSVVEAAENVPEAAQRSLELIQAFLEMAGDSSR